MKAKCKHCAEVKPLPGTMQLCPHCHAVVEGPRDVIPIREPKPRHYIHLELLDGMAFKDLSFLPGMDEPPSKKD